MNLADRLKGIGIGLGAVLGALSRDEASPSPGRDASPTAARDPSPRTSGDSSAGAGTTATATTARFCRKPLQPGFRCYAPDGHPPPCQPEAIDP